LVGGIIVFVPGALPELDGFAEFVPSRMLAPDVDIPSRDIPSRDIPGCIPLFIPFFVSALFSLLAELLVGPVLAPACPWLGYASANEVVSARAQAAARIALVIYISCCVRKCNGTFGNAFRRKTIVTAII
jgi:hypothetical protein